MLISRSPSQHPQVYILTGESQLLANMDDFIKAQKEDTQLSALHNHLKNKVYHSHSAHQSGLYSIQSFFMPMQVTKAMCFSEDCIFEFLWHN